MNVHTLDPESSYEAAALMERGTRQRHYDLVMVYVARHPGLTASQYAEMCGLDDVETRRRLTDAKNKGTAYQQGYHRAAGRKTRECQWWPVERQGGLW